MSDSMMELGVRLATPGAVSLSDEERGTIVAALGALAGAQSQIALHQRLLESYGHDVRELLRTEEATMAAARTRFELNTGDEPYDPSAGARARDALREQLERASSGAEWIGLALDLVRIII